MALSAASRVQTYVVGGLRDVAESRRREPGDDLLDLDVFGRHDGGYEGGGLMGGW
jgi:hypothetical protein